MENFYILLMQSWDYFDLEGRWGEGQEKISKVRFVTHVKLYIGNGSIVSGLPYKVCTNMYVFTKYIVHPPALDHG